MSTPAVRLWFGCLLFDMKQPEGRLPLVHVSRLTRNIKLFDTSVRDYPTDYPFNMNGEAFAQYQMRLSSHFDIPPLEETSCLKRDSQLTSLAILS